MHNPPSTKVGFGFLLVCQILACWLFWKSWPERGKPGIWERSSELHQWGALLSWGCLFIGLFIHAGATSAEFVDPHFPKHFWSKWLGWGIVILLMIMYFLNPGAFVKNPGS